MTEVKSFSKTAGVTRDTWEAIKRTFGESARRNWKKTVGVVDALGGNTADTAAEHMRNKAVAYGTGATGLALATGYGLGVRNKKVKSFSSSKR
jgi:hypothetical protein